MTETKINPLKNHIDLRNLALAFAIIFAAGVFGFVSSKAFAIFFLCFVAFLFLVGLAAVFASPVNDNGWLGGIVGAVLMLMAIGILIGGIKEALNTLRSDCSATTATAAAPLK